MNSQQPSGMNTSATESARSHQSGSEQGVRAKAGEAVSKLADVAQQAGSQAKQAASSLASDANQRAKGFLNQQVASGADLVGHVADSVRSAADNLDHSAPQIANLVRGAAERVEEFSDDMRGKSVDELMRTASDFTRRQPALVFGLASLAGFVLLRVLKSSSPDNSRDLSALTGSNGRDNSMAYERLRNSGLTQALTDLLADLGDLVQKEIQLAKAEVTETITSRLRASVWMVAAAFLGLIAALLVVEAAVFALASLGLELHWACLLVAAVLAAGGAAAFYHGRSVAETELLPTRTVRQITKDIKTAKEQLT